MTMGRPPKPAEQKRRIGNPGGRALPELASVADLPALPAGVPSDLGDAGRNLWVAVTSTATAWLAASDHPLLLMLCEMADRREIFSAHLAEHGPVMVRPGDGHVVANPTVAMLTALERQMVHIASALGLAPTDRSRMGVAEVKARNAFEEMLERKRGTSL
jgi:P27 family predicted phage terminase small subunit